MTKRQSRENDEDSRPAGRMCTNWFSEKKGGSEKALVLEDIFSN
jgi:hypothetical protein